MKKLSAFLLILIMLVPGLASAEPQKQVNGETGYTAVIDDSA